MIAFCRTALIAICMALGGTAAMAGDEADIRSRLEQWMIAFNNRDKATACELFSRSLVAYVRGENETGYAERCAVIGRVLDDPARRFSYALDIKEVIVEGNLAVVRLTWTLTISPGAAKDVEEGLDVFRKENDGRWRIVRFMVYQND